MPTPRTYRTADRAGTRLATSLLLLFGLFFTLGEAQIATAQTVATPAGQAVEPAVRFASVWRIRGDITATAGDTGRTRKLQEGDAVFVGERVRAQTTGEAVLKTDDAGLLALRPGAIFVAERFSAEGKPSDAATLRVVSGALRLISGWIAQTSRSQYRVITPSATIGIRGTDHEPYVMTAELAAALEQPAGTYDKVNRGGTTLDANNNTVDIDPGKVGFVRAARATTTRALMTLLLPVLLDKVPAFYVPGEFDAELDQLSAVADENAARELEERRRTGPQAPAPLAPPSAASTPESTTGTTGTNASAPVAAVALLAPAVQGRAAESACAADNVARTWVAQLDGAIARRNAAAILRLFAPQTVVQATVRDKDGARTTLDIGRDEFVQSTITALKKLTEYKQRRPVLDARPEVAGSCERIAVRSVVIEQGKQNGNPYRFESVEEYVLERQAGKWLAVKAATTQQ